MSLPAVGERMVVGIGELAAANRADQTIVTHALGSCIAVCLFDPVARVAAMLHFLLPDSAINPERARTQPGSFADTGVPVLLDVAGQLGLDRRRALVTLVGGADVSEPGSGCLHIGRRNALAAKNVIWRCGLLVTRQDVGGALARTVHLSARDGLVQVFNGRELVKEL